MATTSADTPKKGKQWLAVKLRDQAERGGTSPSGGNRLWHEPETQTFSFRRMFGRPALSDTAPPQGRSAKQRTHAELLDVLLGDAEGARQQLRAGEVIDLLSVRFRARDMKRRGKLVETWLRGSLLKRVILRTKPTREGISHDRYSLLMMFLMHRGVAEPDERNGYRWCEGFTQLPKRAEWLVELVRVEGELRHVAASQRFVVCE